ncbi:MAG: M48 family metallopeptidase [Candidatus Vogelbacteria bacterium]|nr:M48 family metallopeptidase [Candidatus Vogelbacteria bacterium]
MLVTVPWRVPLRLAEKFVADKQDWIKRQVEISHNRLAEAEKLGLPKRLTPTEKKKHYLSHKEQVRKNIVKRVAELNENYGFKYGAISIRNQSTRWGSCSKKGNLNFNYKVGLLPQSLSDYVIVHELCHLKEFNHSSRFWLLVAETIPDYLVLRRELQRKGLVLS